MSLRIKFIGIVVFIVSFYVLSFNLLVRISFLKASIAAGSHHVETNILTLKKIILQQLVMLDTTTKDYAYWDDTYDFIKNRNNEYISSNFTKEMMKNLKLRDIVFLDNSNKVVASINYSPELNEIGETSDAFKSHILSILYNKKTDNSSDAGYLVFENNIYLMSHREILRSDTSGEPVGSLVMTKAVDYAFKQNITDNLQMEFKFLPLENIQKEIALTQQTQLKNKKVIVIDHGATLTGYALTEDINNDPVLAIEYKEVNDNYLLAKDFIDKNNILWTGIGAIAMIFSFIFIEIVLIRPLRYLVREINKIRTRKTMIRKIDIKTSGEIGDLVNNINEMLKSLDGYEKKTIEINVELEKKAKELQDNSLEMERLNKHMVGREIRMAELKNEIEDLKFKLGSK